MKKNGVKKIVLDLILDRVFDAWKKTFVSKDGQNIADGLMAIAKSVDKLADKLPKK